MSSQKNQIALFDVTEAPDPRDIHGAPDLETYDVIIVMTSGGKDSTAVLLHLLEQGVPRRKIELWHHRVDGGFDEPRVWDWPVTDAYLKAFAEAFDLPLYFSWKHAGITGEMLRQDALTQPTSFQLPGGKVMTSGGVRGQKSTRRMFPAVSPDLKKRFCSGTSKIDVGAMAITGQTRFCGKRTLVCTGERAEESANRSRYLRFEPHRTDRRHGKLARHVDHWRPVLDWDEAEVWDSLRRWGVRPHPVYELGIGRCSCAHCVFSSANQFATLREIDPTGFAQMVYFETDMQHTMKNGVSLNEFADQGTRYAAATPERAAIAMSETYDLPILMEPAEWTLPAGAFGDSAGPQ